MTKRSRPDLPIVTTAESSRPDKCRRLEQLDGLSVDDPIILDDSDEQDFRPKNFLYNVEELFEFQNEAQPWSGTHITISSSSDDELAVLGSSPARLFYRHDETDGRIQNLPTSRVLPVLTMAELSGKGKQKLLHLSPDWFYDKRNCIVNIFFEGEEFANTQFQRHSHLHMPNFATPDLDNICLGDVRRELCRLLDLEDPLALQLEIQDILATKKHKIFRAGICRRPNAMWDDNTVDDRQALSKALKSNDSWIRVRIVQYIKLNIESKGIITAVTPCQTATTQHLRRMVASIADTTAGAITLMSDYSDLDQDDAPLRMIGILPYATIIAAIEERECVNCLGDVGVRDYPFEPTTDDCRHDLNVCKQCLSTWITTSLDNGNWKDITCLTPDCGAIMHYVDIKRVAEAADVERYERFSTRDALALLPGFRYCLNPECDYGQIHDDGGGMEQILTCHQCNFKRCVACDRAWHQDETCDEYTTRLAAQPGEVDASEAWVASNSKRCPGCQSPIQKNDGCDHMTCTRCRRQFCWLCNADYVNIHREGNGAHAPSCKYHSGRVPDPHAYNPMNQNPMIRVPRMMGPIRNNVPERANPPVLPQAQPVDGPNAQINALRLREQQLAQQRAQQRVQQLAQRRAQIEAMQQMMANRMNVPVSEINHELARQRNQFQAALAAQQEQRAAHTRPIAQQERRTAELGRQQREDTLANLRAQTENLRRRALDAPTIAARFQPIPEGTMNPMVAEQERVRQMMEAQITHLRMRDPFLGPPLPPYMEQADPPRPAGSPPGYI